MSELQLLPELQGRWGRGCISPPGVRVRGAAVWAKSPMVADLKKPRLAIIVAVIGLASSVSTGKSGA